MNPPPFPANGTVEIRPGTAPRPGVRLIVFDFDGTLSWLRHGWPDMMVAVAREAMAESGVPEDRRPSEGELLGMILGLNGRPTVVQMQAAADLAVARGARTRPVPEVLRDRFQARLDTAIDQRVSRIRTGQAAAEGYVIHGARALLEGLVRTPPGATPATRPTLAVLSTTVQERVREEAALLDLSRYFDGRVFGGTGDPAKFSKHAVLERMLAEADLPGSALLGFGDGPAEIEATKALGGLAVAVCSDEVRNGSGVCDPHKRERLLAAGADAVVPDYRDAVALTTWLTGG